ncbi:MAG: cytochrome c nitrite reductase small subunit [Candidatus Zixiibacteriota bacterium]|jgi:cytochrome c nitrite reductase small subunit
MRGHIISAVLKWAAVAAIGAAVGLGAFTFVYARGYSYLSNDPEVCVNCHVMRDNYDSWTASSHRGETCNECHVPHGLVGKYAAKAESGFRHSWAFTFEDVQVLRANERSREMLNENCMQCHAGMTAAICANETDLPMDCIRCHSGAGHVF